jgi:hypothetical protein
VYSVNYSIHELSPDNYRKLFRMVALARLSRSSSMSWELLYVSKCIFQSSNNLWPITSQPATIAQANRLSISLGPVSSFLCFDLQYTVKTSYGRIDSEPAMWPYHESHSKRKRKKGHQPNTPTPTPTREKDTIFAHRFQSGRGRSSTDLFGKRPVVELAGIPREQTLDRLKPPGAWCLLSH